MYILSGYFDFGSYVLYLTALFLIFQTVRTVVTLEWTKIMTGNVTINYSIGLVGTSGASGANHFAGSSHLHYEILDGTNLNSPRLDPSDPNRRLLPIEREWSRL